MMINFLTYFIDSRKITDHKGYNVELNKRSWMNFLFIKGCLHDRLRLIFHKSNFLVNVRTYGKYVFIYHRYHSFFFFK